MHKISLSQFVSCKQRNEWQENVQKFYRYRNCGQRCVWSRVECNQITEAMGYVTTECRPQTHGCPPLTADLLFVVTIIIKPHVNPVQNECYITDERQWQSNSVKVGSLIFLFCLKMILKSTLVLQVDVILQIFLEVIQVLKFHREPDLVSNVSPWFFVQNQDAQNHQNVCTSATVSIIFQSLYPKINKTTLPDLTTFISI